MTAPPTGPGPEADLCALARAAGQGNDVAMAKLLGQCRGLVWKVCAAAVDSQAADDLTQDTLVRVLRSAHTYRGESDPRRWIVTIARRVCADEIGRRQRERALLARLAAPGQDQRQVGQVDPILEIDLADALSRLPADRRRALVLTAVAGLTYVEAATVSGCETGTIRSRVSRAREELDGAWPVGESLTVAGAAV